jgi:hypothetical protein
MSDFDGRMAQVLDDAVPDPPRTLNPAVIRAGQLTGETRSRRVRAVSAVAAVVVLVAGIVAVIAAIGGPNHAPVAFGTGTGAGGTTAGPGPIAESPREITIHAVDRLLAVAPAIPGAVPRSHAPAAHLGTALGHAGSPNLVARTAWWVVPSVTTEHVLQYFDTHLPAGFRGGHNNRAIGTGGWEVICHGYSPSREWNRTADYIDMELSISVMQIDNNVAVQVTADAIWLPPRGHNSYVPMDFTGAQVVIRREGFAPTVRRTIPRRDAAQLAKLVNRLAVPPPGLRFCPAEFAGQYDVVRFDGAAHVSVVVSTTGCPSVTVRKGGRSVAYLKPGTGGVSVNAVVLHLLGLPRDYGTH